MLFKRWRTGVTLMRSAKWKQTWRQRARRLGRSKRELILRIGETPDEMVIVSDRLHDFDWVSVAATKFPTRWWIGADNRPRVEPAEDDTPRSHQLAFEINETTAIRFLWFATGRFLHFERAYHRDGWCVIVKGCGKITTYNRYTTTREEVFSRVRLIIEYLPKEVSWSEITYAEFLELDTSSFWDGWKRWFTEWIRFAGVSVFGER